jgi:hypothetical protein
VELLLGCPQLVDSDLPAEVLERLEGGGLLAKIDASRRERKGHPDPVPARS